MNFFAKKSKLLLARTAEFPYITPCARGLSAVGSAPPCQGGGRGFEPRSPLHASTKAGLDRPFSYRRSGQVVRQGPAKPSPPVRIRASPPRAHRAPAFAGALFCIALVCLCRLPAKHRRVLARWGLWMTSPGLASLGFQKKLRFPLAREARFPYCISLRRGLSAVGSAPPCQGGGRGFEPRSPLHESTRAGHLDDRPFLHTVDTRAP